MKPSARVALIVALTTTAPTWASLPFYSPDYAFDSMTGTGFTHYNVNRVSALGIAAATIEYHESNVGLNHFIVTWRGNTPLPTPLEDFDHINPHLRDINRDGWTCGFTAHSNNTGVQAAVWRPDGTRVDLPLFPSPLPDEASGYAFHINDAGFVTGQADKFEDFGLFQRPVYWTPSFEMVELPNPFATSNEYWSGGAGNISPTGIITGTVSGRAVRWDINGTAPILSETTDTGITFTTTGGSFVANDGTIVGIGNIGNKNYGILWTPDGEAIELRNLPASTTQEVILYGFNNNHYSVGAARNSSGQRVAVRWSSNGEPLALDRLPDAPSTTNDYAYDINDLDFAVGVHSGSTYKRGVLWTPDGGAIDMNSLVQSNGEWNYIAGTTITNTGWISGAGVFDPAGPPEAYYRPISILVPFAGTYGMGDANFDESIDFADLLIVAQNYGTETNGSFDVGDFNLDGSVNFTDLLAIAQNYGTVLGDVFTMLPNSPNPTFESDWQAARGMVPEPGVVGLLGVGVMLRRRR